MEEKEITIVIASQKTLADKQANIDAFVSMAGCNLEIIFIEENTSSLSEVYNQAFDMARNNIVVFTHDDVVPLKQDWGKDLIELYESNQEYGIIGVAGSKHYGLDDKLEWWYQKNGLVGMIFHGTEEKSFFSLFKPFNLKSDIEEVSVIDGVFISCRKDKITENFDKSIEGFHFYDIDFCLSNRNRKTCKIGVTSNICLRHESTGKPNEQWVSNGLKIKEKHKDKLPLKTFDNEYKKR